MNSCNGITGIDLEGLDGSAFKIVITENELASALQLDSLMRPLHVISSVICDIVFYSAEGREIIYDLYFIDIMKNLSSCGLLSALAQEHEFDKSIKILPDLQEVHCSISKQQLSLSYEGLNAVKLTLSVDQTSRFRDYVQLQLELNKLALDLVTQA